MLCTNLQVILLAIWYLFLLLNGLRPDRRLGSKRLIMPVCLLLFILFFSFISLRGELLLLPILLDHFCCLCMMLACQILCEDLRLELEHLGIFELHDLWRCLCLLIFLWVSQEGCQLKHLFVCPSAGWTKKYRWDCSWLHLISNFKP